MPLICMVWVLSFLFFMTIVLQFSVLLSVLPNLISTRNRGICVIFICPKTLTIHCYIEFKKYTPTSFIFILLLLLFNFYNSSILHTYNKQGDHDDAREITAV